jgi:hypothetical protein
MVSPTESIRAALQPNWEMIDSALERLDDTTLRLRLSEECNSIAWILWHMSRVVDAFINTRILKKTRLSPSGRALICGCRVGAYDLVRHSPRRADSLSTGLLSGNRLALLTLA